jgi:hypothetical protein
VSLPDERVFPLLQRNFVLGWKNIRKEEYVGDSFGYSRKQSCVGTTNGAGGKNVQLFILSSDHVVLHALPGFWHPEDLARELRLALASHRLWQDERRTLAQKRRMYQRLVLTDLRYQPAATYARSDWQGFDKFHEGRVGSRDRSRDTFEHDGAGKLKVTGAGAPILKPMNVLAHQRMAARAFLPFEEFDIKEFVDYGTRFYDNNRGRSGRGRKLK